MNYDYYLVIKRYFSITEIHKISDINKAIEKYENCWYESDFVELIGVKDGKERIIISSYYQPVRSGEPHKILLKERMNNMYAIKIIWENVNCPSDLGELTLVKGDLKIYTPDNISGIFVYKEKARKLEYFDYTKKPNKNVFYSTLFNVSFLVHKTPDVLHFP